ncbi:hypothetical protein [Mycobacterium sp. Marseille-P9652]|uniref:hypothetical protein n=1 Tax=Mycobacterium sp. Marseille-P9652 TaxID=2654950 RepID=UPI001E314125|nr:hypothetical protein [Mycobacterium sp. Marseille-P9652]
MTQPEDVPVRPVAETAPPRYDETPSRLLQVAAVVGIVAGVVFVVAVVFFAGFFLGASAHGYGGWRFGGHMGAGGRAGTCPMMNGGDGMPAGPMMPGGMMGPGMMGPGMMGPGAVPSPQPSTPATPTPRP